MKRFICCLNPRSKLEFRPKVSGSLPPIASKLLFAAVWQRLPLTTSVCALRCSCCSLAHEIVQKLLRCLLVVEILFSKLKIGCTNKAAIHQRLLVILLSIAALVALCGRFGVLMLCYLTVYKSFIGGHLLVLSDIQAEKVLKLSCHRTGTRFCSFWLPSLVFN